MRTEKQIAKTLEVQIHRLDDLISKFSQPVDLERLTLAKLRLIQAWKIALTQPAEKIKAKSYDKI